MPFAGFVNFQDCVRQNPDKDDPDAYCGSIQARTENKLAKAVTAASHLNQAVRNALKAVVAKHDTPKSPHKEHMRGGRQAESLDVEVGDWIRTPEGFRGQVVGEGLLGSHEWPAWKIDDGSGKMTAVLKEDAEVIGRDPTKKAVVAKAHDPVKEEGDKKLKESDGVAADGAQDDQAFAVAFGPDNYDQLTK
ncbi:hypothetical protein LCGC14_2542050, partial [marine sediment metagenome]